MKSTIPYRYLALEGNIGAGKTSLAEILKEHYNCRLILEQFTDNPFLPFFYQEPERYAFPLELFFMTERYKQLTTTLPQHELFAELAIADYSFIKTLLFARNNLQDEEFRMFQKMFHTLNAALPKPDIIFYLHRNVPNLKQQIDKRGREYEMQIEPSYLQAIQNAYFEYFRIETSIPIVIIDVENINFKDNKAALEDIMNCLERKYLPGVHQVILSRN